LHTGDLEQFKTESYKKILAVASYPMGTMGVKRPGRETDHSLPSSAEDKNAWSYTFTPLIRLHEVTLIQIIWTHLRFSFT
jgi:hypothetical protein